jgi:nitroreductase
MTSSNTRTADHEIDPWFLDRWSPRAFTSEEIPLGDLEILLEAARWAPSSYNSQPWRLLYARRGTPHWERFLGLLNPFNQSWAKNAAVLIIMVSSETMVPPGADKAVPAYSHSFDAGAAWAQLALQGARLGWYAHAMVGFDHARSATELEVPAGFRVEAAIAIGRKAAASTLPEALAAREKPSPRNPLSAIAFEGNFKK